MTRVAHDWIHLHRRQTFKLEQLKRQSLSTQCFMTQVEKIPNTVDSQSRQTQWCVQRDTLICSLKA